MIKKFKWKASIFLALVIIALSAFYYLTLHSFSLADFKEYVNSFGSLVPLVLLLMIILTSSIGLFFMIPVAAAALILDFRTAFLLSLLGLTTGAMFSFYIVRYLGRDYFEKKIISRIDALKAYDKHLEKKGFLSIFFLRLITLTPYELVNVAAGLSRIPPSQFFLATLLGIIPGTLITLYFVKSTNDIGSPQFYIAMIMLTAFAIIPLMLKKVRKIILNG